MYKKWFLITAVVLFIVFEFAGSEKGANQQEHAVKGPNISMSELSKKEESLLNAGGTDTVLAFDYSQLGQNFSYVDVWVDVYKNGDEAKRLLQSTASIKEDNNGRIILTRQNLSPNGKREKWVQTVIHGNGGYAQSAQIRPRQSLDGGRMTGQMPGVMKIEAGETIILAVSIQDSEAQSFSIDSAVYDNDPSAVEELRNRYQYVYMLRCEFRKDK